MTECRLYDATGRTIKPMLDADGGQLVFGFGSEPPQNGDIVEIDGTEYLIQRVWLQGELVIRLRQAGGTVRC